MGIKYRDNHLRPNSTPAFILPGDLDRGIAANSYFKKANTSPKFYDEAAYRIAALVAQKGWELPGIEVECSIIEWAGTPIHKITRIKCTVPGRLWSIGYSGHEFDSGHDLVPASAGEITIPKCQLEIHSDGSGGMTLYVGDDWLEDEETFHRAYKHHAKLNKEPYRWLRYNLSGSEFIHTNDCGRDYDPHDDSLKSFDIVEMQFSVSSFLDKLIEELEAISDCEIGPYEKWEQLSHVEQVKCQKQHTFYLTQDNDRKRSQEGIALIPMGRRFCPLSYTGHKEYIIPDIATEGYSYGFAWDGIPQECGRLWGEDIRSSNVEVYEVTPIHANDIYVADEAPTLACRSYLGEENTERDRFSHEEMAEMYALAARSIVPLNEYQGNYKMPVYLIGRPLLKEEAKNITQDVRRQKFSLEERALHFGR